MVAVHTPAGRAALLHALAHIELNAIDLALDVVWRFAGLPEDFYRQWLQVAREEALHFELLRDHLATLGHAYGDNPKLLVVGHSCIGLTGSVAHYTALIQTLRNLGEDCRLGSNEEVFATFTRVHKRLKDDFFLNPKKQPDDPYEANHISALVANGSGIYGVYAHREVLNFGRFWANGTGRPYALGAMHAAWQMGGDSPQALAVARQGQVSRAAATLHVTQSAVTVGLRDLERSLGLPLFTREAHGMELTEDGRAFLDYALQIDAAVSRVDLLGRSSATQGRLRLAATTMSA